MALDASGVGSLFEGSSLDRASPGGSPTSAEESRVPDFESAFPEGLDSNTRGAPALGSSTLGTAVAGP